MDFQPVESNQWYGSVSQANHGKHSYRVGQRAVEPIGGCWDWEYRDAAFGDRMMGSTRSRDEAVACCEAHLRSKLSEDERMAALGINPGPPICPFDQWNPVSESDLYDAGAVVVYAGGMAFVASLVLCDNGDKEPTWAWVADRPGIHPPCWTDGRCWERNADDEPSAVPTHWMPIPHKETP